MGEAFVVPEGGVLENKPSSRLADTAPSLALVPMTANPLRSVEITLESEFLLTWHEVRVFRVHVFWGWVGLFLFKRSEEVGGFRIVALALAVIF